jgi:hypothetical protein
LNVAGRSDEAVAREVRLGREPRSTPRFRSAIWFTATIRSAICFRVNPSGNTIRSVRPSGGAAFGFFGSS